MKSFIAIIKLPHITLPSGNCFSTLHGYWKPPNYVIEFWSIGASILFISDMDYINKQNEILKSQKECVKQFWQEYVL